MKKLLLVLLVFVIAIQAKSQLPNSIYSGKQGGLHVQGVVVDQVHGFVYFSFTDKLIKMDLSGKLIGSVTGFVGHLGDLDFAEDGKIYGSLEYKNDAIGKGIKKQLGGKAANEDGFYIAIFDASRIVRPDMNAEKEDLLRTVYIKEAVDDYMAKVKVGDKGVAHRFACSGIDGVAFAPEMGNPKSSKKYLYVAYGIYGDTTRNDNDYQVILKYDVADMGKYAQKLSQEQLHHSGPQKPLEKYFVKTGNSRYGVQNMAYDPTTGNLLLAVYRGSKSQFPNYDLFVVDGKKKPGSAWVPSNNQQLKVKTLALAELGKKDPKSGIRGYDFAYGATGLCPLGNDLFYISHNDKSADGQQQTTIYKYKWVGDGNKAFEMVK
ncbi:MAG: hypothetical protein REI78_09870 [Pedobacter sp.]|nr:hypothetical protein [Pedobacter sp.]MDQ8053322.1 hypothetical protein [Pedobacter sp.]